MKFLCSSKNLALIFISIMQDQYQIQMVEFFHHHSGLLQQKGLLRGDPRNLHLQRNTWFYFEKENRLMFFLVRTCTVWTSNVVPAEIVRRPPWRPSAGGLRGCLRIFWLKSLANPEEIFKKNFFLHFFDNFVWICQ